MDQEKGVRIYWKEGQMNIEISRFGFFQRSVPDTGSQMIPPKSPVPRVRSSLCHPGFPPSLVPIVVASTFCLTSCWLHHYYPVPPTSKNASGFSALNSGSCLLSCHVTPCMTQPTQPHSSVLCGKTQPDPPSEKEK